jgi:hypothetical protein
MYVGVAEGASVGVPVGTLVGVTVGLPVGGTVGISVGAVVGVSVGPCVGVAVVLGASVGAAVGVSVVGAKVGTAEGWGVAVGATVGAVVGCSVGSGTFTKIPIFSLTPMTPCPKELTATTNPPVGSVFSSVQVVPPFVVWYNSPLDPTIYTSLVDNTESGWKRTVIEEENTVRTEKEAPPSVDLAT